LSLTLPVGSLTPYVTPSYIINAPTGIAWSTIPPGSTVTDDEKLAEQFNICARATGQADSYCNQPLRASLNTEQYSGPDYRYTVQQDTGNGRLLLQRWPVMDIVSVQVSANSSFPRQWTVLPTGYYDIEVPSVGVYGTNAPGASGGGGQSIVIAPGYLNWALGRRGYVLKVQYVSGWPHTSLTANVTAGATTIPVDDCTGWAPYITNGVGATGVIYDSGQQEAIQVTTASADSGPGTLTLISALQYNHAVQTLVSTLPQSVMWGVTLFATAQALTRGATATKIQMIPGSGGAMSKGPAELVVEGEILLNPFRRTI
jgi:hypothetical protein